MRHLFFGYWEIYLFRELSLLYSGKTALFWGQCTVHSSIALKLLPSFYSSHLHPLYIPATFILASSILFLFQQLLFSFYSRYSRHFSSFYSSYFYAIFILATSVLYQFYILAASILYFIYYTSILFLFEYFYPIHILASSILFLF